jgi:hypothetical protein
MRSNKRLAPPPTAVRTDMKILKIIHKNFSFNSRFKGTMSRDGHLFQVPTFSSLPFVYALMDFKVLVLKMLTETVLLCGWLMFSSADLSLSAGKMRRNKLVTGGFRYDFTESQAASCKHFQCQSRRFRVFKAGPVTEWIFKTSQ